MALLLVGLIATLYGLDPPRPKTRPVTVRLRVQALDDAELSAAHVGLLLVMAAAVTIDVMKPVTLSFVVPGMAREYGLSSALNPVGSVPVAYLPFQNGREADARAVMERYGATVVQDPHSELDVEHVGIDGRPNTGSNHRRNGSKNRLSSNSWSTATSSAGITNASAGSNASHSVGR